MLITKFSSRSSFSRFIELVLSFKLFSIDLQSVCCLRTGSREFIKNSESIIVLSDQVLQTRKEVM